MLRECRLEGKYIVTVQTIVSKGSDHICQNMNVWQLKFMKNACEYVTCMNLTYRTVGFAYFMFFVLLYSSSGCGTMSLVEFF